MPKLSGKIKERLNAEFIHSREGTYELYLAPALVPKGVALICELARLAHSPERWTGNRSSAIVVQLAGLPELVVRRGRRGGLTAWVLSNLYFGFVPRAVVELGLAAEALARGIPVARPMGAIVEWIAPFAYRSYYLTRKEPGLTLWEFVLTAAPPPERFQVFDRAREAIEAMYRGGLCHADLNLHNLFVSMNAGAPAVTILDLDKARLFNQSLSPKKRARSRARLLRSVRKLDPHGQLFDREALLRLGMV
jgi:hypothetical protein